MIMYFGRDPFWKFKRARLDNRLGEYLAVNAVVLVTAIAFAYILWKYAR